MKPRYGTYLTISSQPDSFSLSGDGLYISLQQQDKRLGYWIPYSANRLESIYKFDSILYVRGGGRGHSKGSTYSTRCLMESSIGSNFRNSHWSVSSSKPEIKDVHYYFFCIKWKRCVYLRQLCKQIFAEL